MACTDVARTKAKATAINLIIVFLLFDPQEEIFLKNAINSAVVVSVQYDRSVRQRAFAAPLIASAPSFPLETRWATSALHPRHGSAGQSYSRRRVLLSAQVFPEVLCTSAEASCSEQHYTLFLEAGDKQRVPSSRAKTTAPWSVPPRVPAAVARTQLASERLKRSHSGIKRRSNDAQTL
jgi:hypothetical protein